MLQIIPQMNMEVMRKILGMLPEPHSITVNTFLETPGWSDVLASNLPQGISLSTNGNIKAKVNNPTKEKIIDLMLTSEWADNGKPRADFESAEFYIGQEGDETDPLLIVSLTPYEMGITSGWNFELEGESRRLAGNILAELPIDCSIKISM